MGVTCVVMGDVSDGVLSGWLTDSGERIYRLRMYTPTSDYANVFGYLLTAADHSHFIRSTCRFPDMAFGQTGLRAAFFAQHSFSRGPKDVSGV